VRETYYDCEISVPLETLNLAPAPGAEISADIGILPVWIDAIGT